MSIDRFKDILVKNKGKLPCYFDYVNLLEFKKNRENLKVRIEVIDKEGKRSLSSNYYKPITNIINYEEVLMLSEKNHHEI